MWSQFILQALVHSQTQSLLQHTIRIDQEFILCPLDYPYISLHIPDSRSLKSKRHIIKPILSRLHREFNISVVEYDRQDAWQEAELGIAMISNDHKQLEQVYHANH